MTKDYLKAALLSAESKGNLAKTYFALAKVPLKRSDVEQIVTAAVERVWPLKDEGDFDTVLLAYVRSISVYCRAMAEPT